MIAPVVSRGIGLFAHLTGLDHHFLTPDSQAGSPALAEYARGKPRPT
ncbi:MAG: hypothetical protein ACT4PO_10140 [Actinomycetota bacterium]